MKKIYLTDTSCRERGDKIDARGVNGEFDAEINSIWDQIDRPLADLKIKKPYHEFLEAVDNRAPYEKFMEAVRHEVTSDKEGLIIGCEQLISRKEFEEIGLSTYIEKVCAIYREVWKLQGKEFSANFVRTIYQKAVVPQLDQCRDEVNSVCKEYFSIDLNDLHSHSFLLLEIESIHRREIDYRLGIGLWQRFFSDYVDNLKEEWFAKCEIEARELEHTSALNRDAFVGDSQSRQIDAPSSESQELSISQGDHYVFRIDGAAAIVKYDGCEIRGLKVTKGIELLAFFIANQGKEFDSPLEFDNAFEGATPLPDGMRKGETPHAKDGFRSSSKVQYHESGDPLKSIKARIREIDSEIRAAQETGQVWEIEALAEEKSKILKHGGEITARLRYKSNWDPESKKIITKHRNSLKRALNDIRKQTNGTQLAEHFKQALFPFTFPLRYSPSPAIDWQQ